MYQACAEGQPSRIQSNTSDCTLVSTKHSQTLLVVLMVSIQHALATTACQSVLCHEGELDRRPTGRNQNIWEKQNRIRQLCCGHFCPTITIEFSGRTRVTHTQAAPSTTVDGYEHLCPEHATRKNKGRFPHGHALKPTSNIRAMQEVCCSKWSAMRKRGRQGRRWTRTGVVA